VRKIAGALFVFLAAFSSEAAAQTKPFGEGGVLGRIERAARKREAAIARDTYDPIFRKYSKRYFGVGYDWRHFKAQGMAESELNPTAKSRVGARGIMQLMPGTFNIIFDPRKIPRNITDPEFNIAAGIMHDRYLYTRWIRDNVAKEDQADFMFASYNAGEGPIIRARKAALQKALDAGRWDAIEVVAPNITAWRYRETLGYVRKIRENYGELKK
jgi:membrane-bound lytic murein transglycosylase MltF